MGIDDFRGRRIGACCKGCEDRHTACHDSCERYKQAKSEWDEYKASVKKAKELSEYDKYIASRRSHDRKSKKL